MDETKFSKGENIMTGIPPKPAANVAPKPGATQTSGHHPTSSTPKPTTSSVASTKKVDYFQSKMNLNWWFIGAGLIVSMGFGTWGITRTVELTSELSTIALWIVILLGGGTMLSVNARQLAFKLTRNPPAFFQSRHGANLKVDKIWHLRRLSFYAIDWMMTFGGLWGFNLIIFMVQHPFREDPVKWGFALFGVIVFAVIAMMTAYSLEEAIEDNMRYDNLHNHRPEFSGFDQMQILCLYVSGYIGLAVSAVASAIGAYILMDLGNNMGVWDINEGWQFAGSGLVGVILQTGEMRLLEKRNRTWFQNALLGFAWFGDAGTIFCAMGGISIFYSLMTDQISTEVITLAVVGLLAKSLTAYNSAVEAELSIREARTLLLGAPAPEHKPQPESREDETPHTAPTPPDAQITDGPLPNLPVGKSSMYPGWSYQKPSGDPKSWVYFQPQATASTPQPKPRATSPQSDLIHPYSFYEKDEEHLDLEWCQFSPAYFEVRKDDEDGSFVGFIAKEELPDDVKLPPPPREPTYHPVGMTAAPKPARYDA